MTNLLIAFNDIPLNAKTITSSNTCNEVYNQFNLLSNRKYHHVKLDSGATTQSFTFDLGYDGASDITQSAEYFLFNAKQIDISNLTSIVLEGSNDGSIWSLIDTVLPAELVTLKGKYLTDYITTFTETSAFRYWRVKQTTTSSATGNWGKFYFGKFLDFAREPDDVKLDKVLNTTRFQSDSGQVKVKKATKDLINLEITWLGISDAKLAEFENIIRIQPKALVWLYCQNDASFLDGIDLLSVNIDEVEIERYTDYNEIKIKFIEAI